MNKQEILTIRNNIEKICNKCKQREVFEVCLCGECFHITPELKK